MNDSMTDGALWVDKYRPKTLSNLALHKDLSLQIQRLCKSNDLPHIFFYGPSGAGKRTRVFALLRQLYGESVDKIKVDHRVFKVGDPVKDVELTTVSSSHHIAINPSDAGNNDRLVIQQLIKEIAASVPLDMTKSKQGPNFKVVVLHEVDLMSRSAQQSLRRTMERYARTCRIIMVAESSTRVIEPLRSRCLAVRVPAPTTSQINDLLVDIARKQRIDLPPTLSLRIAEASDRNTRRAILQLQATVVNYASLTDTTVPIEADWELLINEIQQQIMKDQNPRSLHEIRSLLYDLLCHAIPPDVIFKRLVISLLKSVDQDLASSICTLAAIYEHRTKLGTKPILHLEGFVGRFMQLYKNYITSQYSLMLDDFD